MEPQEIVEPQEVAEAIGDAAVASAAAVSAAELDVVPNYAKNAELAEKVRVYLGSAFSQVSGRSELEAVWQKNDEMYRVKPDADSDSEHRANEATGIFNIAINQLTAMAFKVLTDNPEEYRYEALGPGDNEAEMAARKRNADLLTRLFRIAQEQHGFKMAMRRLLYGLYKYGVAFVRIVFPNDYQTVMVRDKITGERRVSTIARDTLPYLAPLPIEDVYLDENMADIPDEQAVFIRLPLLWQQIYADVKSGLIYIPEDSGQTLREAMNKYGLSVSDIYYAGKGDRFENADRTLTDHNTSAVSRGCSLFRHWVVYARLPIVKGEWDENGAETWYRVRIIGDPDNCIVAEIREDISPGGIPILRVPHSIDDIGIYPISLGERVATYYDQICTAINQLIDNRSKNNRRPIVYNALMVKADQYDFGHSNAIPCDGDPRGALMEMGIADMTGTIMNTIVYCEQKIREIMNVTDTVVGEAMGGRTSASEYQGAKIAATTPIFADFANIEQAVMVEYMRRFADYVHAFMSPSDMMALLGEDGAAFSFSTDSRYKIVARGVLTARDKQMQMQTLLHLSSITQDPRKRDIIMLRIAQLSGVENPSELVPQPAVDQAVKAALWENNEMLIFGQWDEPESGELHDVHLPIHIQAEWQARAEKNPNVNYLRQHIARTEMLAKQEAIAAGGPPANPAFGSQDKPTPPPTPGQESGWQLSAIMGSQQGGSVVPAT